ncbi:hypothetical protein QR680_012303 [Steinernema hermaphroditum]|uniref:Uncharacterized protein n=1 Tax=Steinernema hermaphroditum TaxID=289476 RepID=A0AA39M0J3_9BILA|nr:hypothetical protein QR680_012303 [Steinernema hermaphroditum]
MSFACRRICVFLAVPLFTLSFSLALTALVTDFWFEATPVDRQGNTYDDSFVHSGLFAGVRQLNWGLGSKFEPFLVYKEVHDGVSFMCKFTWVFNIFFLCLGLLWIAIGITVSFVSTVSRKDDSVVGSSGIYLWSILSQLSLSASALLYLLQFFTAIKANVLLEDQLNYGFSTANRVQLGYSFWFLVGAIGSLFIPSFLMIVTRQRRSKKDEMVVEPIDHTVFFVRFLKFPALREKIEGMKSTMTNRESLLEEKRRIQNRDSVRRSREKTQRVSKVLLDASKMIVKFCKDMEIRSADVEPSDAERKLLYIVNDATYKQAVTCGPSSNSEALHHGRPRLPSPHNKETVRWRRHTSRRREIETDRRKFLLLFQEFTQKWAIENKIDHCKTGFLADLTAIIESDEFISVSTTLSEEEMNGYSSETIRTAVAECKRFMKHLEYDRHSGCSPSRNCPGTKLSSNSAQNSVVLRCRGSDNQIEIKAKNEESVGDLSATTLLKKLGVIERLYGSAQGVTLKFFNLAFGECEILEKHEVCPARFVDELGSDLVVDHALRLTSLVRYTISNLLILKKTMVINVCQAFSSSDVAFSVIGPEIISLTAKVISYSSKTFAIMMSLKNKYVTWWNVVIYPGSLSEKCCILVTSRTRILCYDRKESDDPDYVYDFPKLADMSFRKM